jgi:hypothetical protein
LPGKEDRARQRIHSLLASSRSVYWLGADNLGMLTLIRNRITDRAVVFVWIVLFTVAVSYAGWQARVNSQTNRRLIAENARINIQQNLRLCRLLTVTLSARQGRINGLNAAFRVEVVGILRENESLEESARLTHIEDQSCRRVGE